MWVEGFQMYYCISNKQLPFLLLTTLKKTSLHTIFQSSQLKSYLSSIDACSICLRDKTNDIASISCCNHTFHEHCIISWSKVYVESLALSIIFVVTEIVHDFSY